MKNIIYTMFTYMKNFNIEKVCSGLSNNKHVTYYQWLHRHLGLKNEPCTQIWCLEHK